MVGEVGVKGDQRTDDHSDLPRSRSVAGSLSFALACQIQSSLPSSLGCTPQIRDDVHPMAPLTGVMDRLMALVAPETYLITWPGQNRCVQPQHNGPY
jgi:hypothetical protein